MTSALSPVEPITGIPPLPEVAGRVFKVFGTFGTLLVTRPGAVKHAHQIVTKKLRAIDLACSRFRPDSELSLANRAAGQEVSISPLFGQALATALRAAEITDGDVDPTCGESLIRLGYDRDFGQVRASQWQAVPTAVPAGGWQHVQLDTRRGTLRVPTGIQLDLGATAKALAADLAAAAVTAATGAGALVNLGGDIAVAGPPPQAGWRVQIDPGLPQGRGQEPGPVVAIWDGGLATSGTVSRSWQAGAERVHHIVVPATGRPAVSCWIAATVAAATCVDANTASTAAIIRSEQAPGWLASHGLPARLVRADGNVVTTGGWPL